MLHGFAASRSSEPKADEGTAPTVTSSFHIEGMSCPVCAATLEFQLSKLPGIYQVTISFDDGTAVVRSSPDGPSEASLRATIEQAGFRISQK
ncbi:heavy-metal-associated domain-containing protein [Thermogutta sp.]|uniref:heavy-metal-associated domain-containing protein n=1 Tax=Thermogutta sp. TaxID=1962930 RepID=UPI003C7DA734